MQFESCAFVANRAPRGGAVCVGEGSSATFAKSLFRDNVATVTGGADIAVQAATLTVESTAFEGGTGPGYGASLHLDRPSFLKILHSTFNPMLDGAATVFLAGRLAGCNEHPCAAGNKCSYANYSLTCTPCDEVTVSSGGLQCVSCDAGTGPNANQTACVACANASFSAFGVCQACADSKDSGWTDSKDAGAVVWATMSTSRLTCSSRTARAQPGTEISLLYECRSGTAP